MFMLGGFTRPRKFVIGSALLSVALFSWLNAAPTPRAVNDVPIVWWAWRDHTPAAAELSHALDLTHSDTLFLRAGQIDLGLNLGGGSLRRIRAAQGALPRGVKLHLVYNATRSLLAQLEQVAPETLATTIAETYAADCARAADEQADLAGLQLDIDVPLRLLPRYQQTLHALRQSLPQGMSLSITGLPAWFESPALADVLAETDFWIPQCYGAEIPRQLLQVIPIAAPRQTLRAVERARRLGKPFFAGLAAYGYAIHYDARGKLLALRGDLNPANVVEHPDLAQRACKQIAGSPNDGEWRCEYVAARECVVDGLVLQSGETLLLQTPSAASLRANARAARQQGGQLLMGLCVFRLPSVEDATNLSAVEIATTLNDETTSPKVAMTARWQRQGAARWLYLDLANTGAQRAMPVTGAAALTLHLPVRQLGRAQVLSHLNHVTPLCAAANELTPCSATRAAALRLSVTEWQPGTHLQAIWPVTGEWPDTLPVTLTLQTDDGRAWQTEQVLELKGATQQ